MSKGTDTHREEVEARLDALREELLSSESDALAEGGRNCESRSQQ